MKLKCLFVSLLATVAVAFTSCSDDYEPSFLDEIQVSSSYVAIPLGGGQTTIQLTTTGNYELKGVPAWLTVTPTSGAAGTANLTFSAESTIDGRSCDSLVVICAGKEQHINVIQGLSTVSTATVKEVLNGIDAKTYRVTGTCTSIANTQYGNFYLGDEEGNELYIYGTVNAGGAYDWASFGIEVGDEVTVEGPRSTYGSTIELVDATFISVSKSLIKVDSIAPENGTIATEGGDFEVFLVNKGNGIYVNVPEDAESWLSIKSIQGDKVTFHAAANTAGPRTANLTFKTKANGKEYSTETSVSQLGAAGSEELPMTVSEAIAYCSTLSGTTTSDFYVKGKVSKVLYTFSGSYGTGTFWISDDGTFNGAENGKSTTDTAHDFEAYSVYWFGNQPWTDGNAQVNVGDEVVICGKLTVYNGTCETSSKAAYVYSVNGVKNDANGVGSLEFPFNTTGAIEAANNGFTGNAFVSGIVSKIVYTFSASYGTGTFWISNDGNYYGDKALDFEAYSVYWNDNKPWAEGDPQVNVGDKVMLYGALTLYNGTAETASKKAYVYSLTPAN